MRRIIPEEGGMLVMLNEAASQSTEQLRKLIAQKVADAIEAEFTGPEPNSGATGRTTRGHIRPKPDVIDAQYRVIA